MNEVNKVTLEELIEMKEAEPKKYEILFGSDVARLVLANDFNEEIARAEDERSGAIAFQLLSKAAGMLGKIE